MVWRRALIWSRRVVSGTRFSNAKAAWFRNVSVSGSGALRRARLAAESLSRVASRSARANTKLLIYGLFQKGRVLAQDGEAIPLLLEARDLFSGGHLLDRHAKLDRDRLERFNRRPVDVRLARLAQTPIAHRDAVAFDIGLERSGAAIHSRRLYDLWDETAFRAGHVGARIVSLFGPRLHARRTTHDGRHSYVITNNLSR